MKQKRILAGILAICMCISLMSTAIFAEDAFPFNDVKTDDWFYSSVKEAYDAKIMNGVSETEFAPNDPVTRGMFITLIYRLENEPAAIYAEEFSDITNDDYFANAVRWAKTNAIADGVSETEFAPNEFIPREQIATIIHRYADYKLGSADTSYELSFNDADDISDYAKDAAAYVQAKAIISGDEKGNMNPKAYATRAEIAAIIMRASAFLSQNGDIVILYTNDVHCGYSDNLGYASVKAYKNAMEQNHEYVTLVDCGDAVQGTLGGSLTDGQFIVQLMNAVGYKYAILGNHEFDYGMRELADIIENSSATYLNCNIEYTGSNENLLGQTVPYAIDTYGDKKVAFIGVATPYSLTSSTPKFFEEDGEIVYDFNGKNPDDFYACIQKNIDECRDFGADYVILMTHCGVDEKNPDYLFSSTDIAKHISGADVFLDAHSHSIIKEMHVTDKDGNDVIISSAGTKLQALGKLTISQDGKLKTELISKYPEKDAALSSAIKEADEMIAELINIPIGENTSANLSTDDADNIRMVRNREIEIGDFCADAYRQIMGADIGLINAGGIRAGIPRGLVVSNDIINVHPFGNDVCSMKVTGQQLADALEWSYKLVEKDYKMNGTAIGESGGFYQVSGIKFTVDTSIPSPVLTDDNKMFSGISGERRVKDIMILDKDGEYKPIDLNAEYTVAANSYVLLNHGDGQTAFDGAENVTPMPCIDVYALYLYVTETLNGSFDKYSVSDNRITIK